MITLILTVVGFIVGAMSAEVPGALLGGAIGFLIGDRVSVRQRLSELEARVAELLRRASPRADSDRPASNEARDDEAARDAVFAAQRRERAEAEEASAPAAPAQPSVARETVAARESVQDAQATMPAGRGGAAPPRRRASEDIPLVRWLRAYFTSGNLVVKIGAIILFIGVAFLLKYAAEHTRVPIEVRMIGVAVGAIVLLLLGWRLRKRRQGYGLILQGIAVGILYLTVFAALRLYALVPAGAAFFLLAGIVVFSGLLAVLQNSLALAIMAAAGGFLAPILTSTGQGSHVMLFSYYAVLNAGLLGIAWFKSWRPLNLLGFLFTFGIGTAWGVLRYRPEQLASTEPFLILFFLLYVAIAVLFAFRQAPRFTYYVDGSLIFGTPVVAFGLQTGLVRDIPFALSFSAVALGAFYLLLATFLMRTRRESLRLLIEAFLALGVAFVTLAVPLALDGRWTAATWALEGAALLWVGLRQNRKLARAAGILLQIGAGVAFFAHTPSATNVPPLVHSGVVGAVLIAVAALVSSRMLERNRERLAGYEQPAMAVLFSWGAIWWVFGWLNEIERIGTIVRPDMATYVLHASLLFVTASAWFSSWLERRLTWPIARIPALLLLPALVLVTIGSRVVHDHPFAGAGWLGWPVAFLAWYAILKRHEETVEATLTIVLHTLGALLLVFLLSVEATWMIARATQSLGVWSMLAWALVPAVTLIALPSLAASGRWPVGRHLHAYLGITGGTLAAYLVVWSLMANLTSRGDPAPLPYMPILNPLDLAQLFVLVALARFLLWHRRSPLAPGMDPALRRFVLGTLGVVLFVWLNAVLLRTLHYWAGIAFDLDVMLESTLVQSALSIFWTVLALAAMAWSARNARRFVWFAGAALMAVVVVKLFLIDLSSVGTVARIVSFLAVGGLMLVIGYLSPIPPTQERVGA